MDVLLKCLIVLTLLRLSRFYVLFSPAYDQMSEFMLVHCNSLSLTIMASSVQGTSYHAADSEGSKGNLKRTIKQTNDGDVGESAIRTIYVEILISISPEEHQNTAGDKPKASNDKKPIRKYAGVACRFSKTLLKNLPDWIDTNPAKVALSILKTIIQIKEVFLLFSLLAQRPNLLSGCWGQQRESRRTAQETRSVGPDDK